MAEPGGEHGAIIELQVPERTAVALEYPGYIQNVDKALEMLGGTSAISSVVASDTAYMRLRFRWAHLMHASSMRAAAGSVGCAPLLRQQPMQGACGGAWRVTSVAVAMRAVW